MDKRKILIQLDSDGAAERVRPGRGHRRRGGRGVQLRRGEAGTGSGTGAWGHLHARSEGPGPDRDLYRRQRRDGGREAAGRGAKHMIPSFGLRVRCCSTPTAPTRRQRRRCVQRPATWSCRPPRPWSWAARAPLVSVQPCCWPGRAPRSVLAPAAIPGVGCCRGDSGARAGSETGTDRHRHLAGPANGPGRANPGDRGGSGRRGAAAESARPACPTLRVAIDLNAVPPLGIEGVERQRQGQGARRRDRLRRPRRRRYQDEGAQVAVARLFESNDQVLDAEQVYALAQGLALTEENP